MKADVTLVGLLSSHSHCLGTMVCLYSTAELRCCLSALLNGFGELLLMGEMQLNERYERVGGSTLIRKS